MENTDGIGGTGTCIRTFGPQVVIVAIHSFVNPALNVIHKIEWTNTAYKLLPLLSKYVIGLFSNILLRQEDQRIR